MDAVIDLDALDPRARDLLEAVIASGRVGIVRRGVPIGVVSFTPTDQAESSTPTAGRDERDRPKIVVTAMDLPDGAREKLAEEFGPGFVVMDLHDAPPSADIVLVHAVSPQLLASLKATYPDAELVIAEVSDPEFGVDFAGPLSRLLDAGASRFLPGRSIPEVANGVRRYVEAAALDAASGRREIRDAAREEPNSRGDLT